MKAALVGVGNPYHGDDGIGPFVARRLYNTLDHRDCVDVLELCTCGFDLVEQLVGYEEAVIFDALIDAEAELGAVQRVPATEAPGGACISFHTVGFDSALAMARLLGLPVPDEIAVYGIVVRDPWNFSTRFSPELESKLPRIIDALNAEFAKDPLRQIFLSR